MSSTQEIYYVYKKARKKFSLKVYLLLLLWLVLALVQWCVVCLVSGVRDAFVKHYYISVVTFFLAILLFALFLFVEKLRYDLTPGILISALIVELQIVSLFALIARTFVCEMLLCFMLCGILMASFVGLGLMLPSKMDLTLHVALLFILGFVFLLVAVFFLMLHLLISGFSVYAYALVQLPITITMLFFVMYHSQTIKGGRFAEMRLHDFLLGSLILFHDFLIIFLLTFYWQVKGSTITPNNWILTTLSGTTNFGNKLIVVGNNYDEIEDDTAINNIPRSRMRVAPSKTFPADPFTAITLDFPNDENEHTNSLSGDNWQNAWLAEENRNPYPSIEKLSSNLGPTSKKYNRLDSSNSNQIKS